MNMSTIQIQDKVFNLFISNEKIESRLTLLADIINKDYNNIEIIVLSVLNGAFMFTADLLKKVNVKVKVSFIKVSSYEGLNSTGELKEIIGIDSDLSNKHVLLIEDIVDTGLTINTLLKQLNLMGVASVEVCTLLFKPNAFKGVQLPKYVGFEIENDFVVGYGLDLNGFGRNTPHIYRIKD